MSRTRRVSTVRARSGAREVTDSLLNGVMTLAFLACLVLLGVFVIGKMRKDASSRPPSGDAARSGGGGGSRSPGRGFNSGGFPGKSEPAAPDFEQYVADLNMAVVSKEISRLRGESTAQKERAASIAHADVLARARQTVLADRILEPQDQFLTVDQLVVENDDPRQVAEQLTRTFQKVAARTTFRFHVRRGVEERVLYVLFAVDASLPDARLVLPARIKITEALALEIRERFWGLGTYYQETYFTPEERDTVVRVLGRSEATPEEYVFITRRILREAAPEANAEQSWLRNRLSDLEKKIKAAPVPDVVVTREGKRIDGRIVEEVAAHVKVDASYGRLTLYRSDIKEIHRADEIRQEFDRRVNAAIQHPEAYPELLTWARDWNLPMHREYVAYLMLLRDPADRTARMAAGYYQEAGGKWVLPEGGAPPPRPETQLPTTRKELQARLEELGFVLQGNKWYQKVPWAAGINSLYHSSEIKWAGQGVAIMTAREGESALAVFSRAQIRGSSVREMFLCPTGTTGTVSIGVTAPGDIQECRVRATGFIVERERMGKIEVALMAEGGKLVPLYSVDMAGNGEYFDVTEAVRGKRRFTVSARLTTTNDKFHTYARFLPSLPDTTEAFWVKGSVLQSAPEIDRSWANAK